MAALTSQPSRNPQQYYLSLEFANTLLHPLKVLTSKPSTPVIHFITRCYLSCLSSFLCACIFMFKCYLTFERLQKSFNSGLQSLLFNSAAQRVYLCLGGYVVFCWSVLAISGIIHTFAGTLASSLVLPRPVPLSSQPLPVRLSILCCAAVSFISFGFVLFRWLVKLSGGRPVCSFDRSPATNSSPTTPIYPASSTAATYQINPAFLQQHNATQSTSTTSLVIRHVSTSLFTTSNS